MAKRKPDTLNCEPFPLLSWDDCHWVCEDSVPAWAEFRSFHSTKNSNGTIIVMVASHARTRTPPAESQIAAYRHLRSNAKRISAAIIKHIFERYVALQTQYEDFVEPSEMPSISQPDDLRRLIGFSGFYLHRTERKGVAYTGIAMDCTWDAEHGIGMMMHKSRIVETGGADTALLEWIAENDAKQ